MAVVIALRGSIQIIYVSATAASAPTENIHFQENQIKCCLLKRFRPKCRVSQRAWYQILYVPVVIAIVLGVLLEQCYPQVGESMKSLGDALIKLVKMIMIGQ
ncbi:MAG TPA: hypothetical protein DD666_05310 [Advenella kashmirensis]|uniref:Uncharacterized protein n=1 Tax=Advenella kashmirensis TaxID=310575 RepID=A0A356LCW9_9BURK|nr:hypothetical protein [Advenella kashmirensis]